jgi:hypothetical protein
MSGWHPILHVGPRKWIVRGRKKKRILGRFTSRKKALQQLRAVEWSMRSRKK